MPAWDLTDDQWMRLLQEDPRTRLVAKGNAGSVIARRPDGTGLEISVDGAVVREYDDEGNAT